MPRRNPGRLAPLAVAPLLLLALAGCTGGSAPKTTTTVTASASPSATPTVTATATATATATPSATPSPTATTAAARCTVAHLRGSWRSGGGAAGTEYGHLVLTNTGGTACVLQGWPGVSLVGEGHGVQLGAAAEEVSGPNGARGATLTVAPGGRVQAQVGIGTAENYGSRCDAATADGFRVYPPGSTESLFVRQSEQACKNSSVKLLSVQPLVAG